MKMKDLQGLSMLDLQKKLKDSRQELFNLRFQMATGQLQNHRQIRHVREDLAQITLSLDEIVHATQAGTARVTAISHAAKEQLAGSDEMVKAIREIREVASSNAKSTEEVSRAIREQAVVTASIASASQELTNLSVELQTVVSRFRLE